MTRCQSGISLIVLIFEEKNDLAYFFVTKVSPTELIASLVFYCFRLVRSFPTLGDSQLIEQLRVLKCKDAVNSVVCRHPEAGLKEKLTTTSLFLSHLSQGGATRSTVLTGSLRSLD